MTVNDKCNVINDIIDSINDPIVMTNDDREHGNEQ